MKVQGLVGGLRGSLIHTHHKIKQMEHYIGQKIIGEYPPSAAVWCSENKAYIKCISVDDAGCKTYEITADVMPNFAIISGMKSELAASDYKVMKCYEASLVGIPAPYDVAALTAERQALRDEINRLEKL